MPHHYMQADASGFSCGDGVGLLPPVQHVHTNPPHNMWRMKVYQMLIDSVIKSSNYIMVKY